VLRQLIHSGVVIPPPPKPTGLVLVVHGEPMRLTAKQDEMALAWARKKDTPYVQDETFVANFLRDFSAALGIEPTLTLDEVDFSAFYAFVDAEREAKERLTPEERKALATERRAEGEALKAQFGYAIVDGQRVELGTYMVEPSGIFMGRGQHPLRGRWKEGARQSDVTLNLSPDAPRPEGDWAEIVWQPDSMWVARWEDKLSEKLKYIWLSDTAPIKQERDAVKFDKAVELDEKLELVRSHIAEGLTDEDERRRMIATACYLIDTLCLRVGDEKDPDEADTVGATTLRPEHVTLRDDGKVEFHFLGKDSVEWHKELDAPPVVRTNLAELIRNARPSGAANGDGDRPRPGRDLPQLFPDISSRDVNAYLSDLSPGITAKVFRTHHATEAVRDSLAGARVQPEAPEYLKWRAASLANYEAAVLCNHTKQYKGDWARIKERYEARMLKAKERLDKCRAQLQAAREALPPLRQEAKERREAAKTPEQRKAVRERYQKRIAAAQARIEKAIAQRQRAEDSLGKIEAQYMMASRKRTWNLGTSLKSYIDPRVYHRWGQEVGYDVLGRYYPTTLRRKFAWVRFEDGDGTLELGEGRQLTLRTCMADDLEEVASFLEAMRQQLPELDLPTNPEEIEARYLPALGKPWRDMMIGTDEEGTVVALVALGPEWLEGEQTRLDILAAVDPAWDGPAAAALMASEVERRLYAYEVQHPRARYQLKPSDPTWLAHAPELVAALGLDARDDGENEEGDEE